MSVLRNLINRFLEIIKWPMALMMVVAVPAAIKGFDVYWHSYMLHDSRGGLTYFGFGAVFFIFCWFFLFARGSGSAEVMEHEITHAIFALLTLHPVTDIEATDGHGGRMAFRGGGNWLIAIAPYFFPTLAFAVMLAMTGYMYFGGRIPDYLFMTLGCMTGYHLCSSLSEIHSEQTDFAVAGWPFSILFLPGANIMVYGVIFGFIDRGFTGSWLFIKLVAAIVRIDGMKMLTSLHS